MNGFDSADVDNNDLFDIFAWQKNISKHRVVGAAGRLHPAFLAGLSLTKDRSINTDLSVDDDDQACAAAADDDEDLYYLVSSWSLFCSSSCSDSLQ